MLKQRQAYETVFLIAVTSKKGLKGALHRCKPGLQFLVPNIFGFLTTDPSAWANICLGKGFAAKVLLQRLVSVSWSGVAEADSIFRKASCVLTSNAMCNDTFPK